MCPDEAAAERAVNEVWGSCFSDTRPFDEVSCACLVVPRQDDAAHSLTFFDVGVHHVSHVDLLADRKGIHGRDLFLNTGERLLRSQPDWKSGNCTPPSG